MCQDTGAKVVFLPPDINPIEEFFGEPKTFVKLRYRECISLVRSDFEVFITACVRAVGSPWSSARPPVT